MPFDISLYDYHLPESNIAQSPAEQRDSSRLLHVDKRSGVIHDCQFPALLDLLESGDVMVVNDTKVFPARLLGKKESGGKVEFMLLNYPNLDESIPCQEEGFSSQVDALGLIKSSKRPKPGSRLIFGDDLEGVVQESLEHGAARVTLRWNNEFNRALDQHGETPLPPYIRRQGGPSATDRQRYQTVYAGQDGAIAAPTAGLHFTDELLAAIRDKGVEVTTVTLHVGYGTFSPVRVEDIRQHKIHGEFISIPATTQEAIARARAKDGKVWAVGTTTTRALEFAADDNGGVRQTQGICDLYIYPGYEFRVVNNLITNFHLPQSSLLFMVSALGGRELIMQAYEKALELDYRFYSYGDAMVLTT